MADVEFVRRCWSIALTDFRRLDLPCDQLWYLGDATSANLDESAELQMQVLTELGLPVRLILGNHDFDQTLSRRTPPGLQLPFFRAAQSTPGWKTLASVSDFYFTDELGEFLVVFLSDHAHPEVHWASTQGTVQADADAYPHDENATSALRELIATAGRPVILAGHYAFPGGNRPSDLLSRLLPLPPNVRIHFHGHAHVGDKSTRIRNYFEKIAWIEGNDIPQVNVSALEDRRGDEIRSAFLELYDDDSLGVFFRDHGRAAWAGAFFV
jgi:hypothetical protein